MGIEKDAGQKKYFFSCQKCAATGIVHAKNQEEMKEMVRQMHANFLKECHVDCSNPVFLAHGSPGTVVEF
ncbi:MAG: hypothetical protein NTW66_02830 [Candidatus Magasanikbacteria bacterium]|nr:hypothetical protein [Candidatus Magasanikbacteria bacterium]